jgi:hypothetical protein
MADFYGTARTNYFKVKDLEAFKAFVDSLSCCVLIEKDGRFGFYSDDQHGSFPSTICNDETGEHETVDVIEVTAGHLAEGEVAVFMEAGSEKQRYISAWSEAINHKGERVSINIDEIYALAERELGVKPTTAEY